MLHDVNKEDTLAKGFDGSSCVTMLKDLNQSAEQKSSMELPPIFSPVRQSGRPKIS